MKLKEYHRQVKGKWIKVLTFMASSHIQYDLIQFCTSPFCGGHCEVGTDFSPVMKGTRGWSTSPYFQVRRRLGVKNTIETESCAEGGSVPCLAWWCAACRGPEEQREEVLLTAREVPLWQGGDCTDSQLGLGTSTEKLQTDSTSGTLAIQVFQAVSHHTAVQPRPLRHLDAKCRVHICMVHEQEGPDGLLRDLGKHIKSGEKGMWKVSWISLAVSFLLNSWGFFLQSSSCDGRYSSHAACDTRGIVPRLYSWS